MKLRSFVLLLMVIVAARAAGALERYSCNMKALTKSERSEHLKVSLRLFGAVQEQKELQNGYAFRLPPEALSAAAQWVSLESKCCPFFTFEMELGGDEGPLWLRITGPEGIKPFIRTEFGLNGD